MRDEHKIEPWQILRIERTANEPPRTKRQEEQIDTYALAEGRIGKYPASEEIDKHHGVTEPRHRYLIIAPLPPIRFELRLFGFRMADEVPTERKLQEFSLYLHKLLWRAKDLVFDLSYA
jgi:hypothetical protein